MGRNYFTFLLLILIYGFQEKLEVHADSAVRVNGIRFGGEGGNTRMVLDLNQNADLNVDQKEEGSFIIRAIDKSLDARKIVSQSHKLVKSVTPVVGDDGFYTLQVQTTPGTRVKKSFTLDGKNGGKRYVVDFEMNPNVPPSNDAPESPQKVPEQEVSPEPPQQNPELDAPSAPSAEQSENIPESREYLTESLHVANKEANPFEESSLPKLVTDLTIEENGPKTVLTLTLAKSGAFTVRENGYTHEIIIEMPKFDWVSSNLKDKSGGVIENYVIDESDPKSTSLILKVQPGTGVLGKFTLPQRNTSPAKFILTLGEGSGEIQSPGPMLENKQPKVTYQPASSSTQHINAGYAAAKTPPPPPGPEFMGGDVPFADVGIGFYMGGQLGHGSAGIKTTTTMTNNNGTAYTLNQGLDGGIASLHMGYGFGFGKFYFGLEPFVQFSNLEGHTRASVSGVPYTRYQDTMTIIYGALARVGAYLAPEVMVYGSVGGVGTDLRHKIMAGTSPNYGFSGGRKTNMSGTLMGVGLEAALDDHLSLRLDYHYIFYQVLGQSGASLSSPTILQTTTVAPKLSQFLIGLSYKFSPMFGPNSRENLGQIPVGLYVGTGPSMSALGVSKKSVTSTQTIQSTTQSLTPGWDLYLGYGEQTNSIYLGGEAGISFGNKMIEESYTAEKRTDKLRSSLTLAFRPGFTFGQGNLVYGRIGGIVSRITHDGVGAPNSQFTIPQNFGRIIYGLAVGGGLEAFINKNLSIRGDYTYELYKKVNMSNATLQSTLGPDNKKFMLGIAYVF